MKSVPDRIKMRREYVWRRQVQKLLAILGAIITNLGAAMLISGLLAPIADDYAPLAYVLSLIAGGVLLGTVGFLYCCNRCKKADAIPYVPPVREQLANASAEEVLLRGSEQPVASPDQLLRAATDQETPTEELLRAGTPE